MNKSHCVGCWSDIYNYENNECWNLEDAELITRYKIHMDSPMNVKANYTKVRKPNCFYSGGYSGDGYAYLNSIQEGAK